MATLLLYTAIPIQDGEHKIPRRSGQYQELLNLAVLEALELMLTSPGAPPSSPTAGGVFSFPAPTQEISALLQTRQEVGRITDGNDADESETDDEYKPIPRMKRTRVSSFSGSAPHLRRVPHKKPKDEQFQDEEPTVIDTIDSGVSVPILESNPETWKNLGSELRTIAEKFSRTSGRMGLSSKARISSKISSKVGPMKISGNLVTIAINILLWKLMRRMLE